MSVRELQLIGDGSIKINGELDLTNADVTAGSITQVTQFQLVTNAAVGKILISDGSGVAGWSSSALGWTNTGTVVTVANTAHTVAIGNNTQLGTEKLLVSGGAVLFDGTSGTTPVSGIGTRLMWIPDKASFRAGEVSGTQWDTANIGQWSTAFGNNNIAAGDYSVAFGNGAQALTRGEFAMASNQFNVPGDAQSSTIMLMRRSTNNALLELTLDGVSPNAFNRFVLKQKTTYHVNLSVVARREDVLGESAAFEFTFVMDRQIDADSVELVLGSEKKILATEVSTWDISLSMDIINSSLRVNVSGDSAKNILWVARVSLVQVTGV
jgi:hypothetical protein